MSEEFVLADLSDARAALEEITGRRAPSDLLEHIFSKFHRSETSGGPGGAGLGLFIARGLVTAMGGRIWVDSAEGGGSSFAFDLPLAEATGRGSGGV